MLASLLDIGAVINDFAIQLVTVDFDKLLLKSVRVGDLGLVLK